MSDLRSLLRFDEKVAAEGRRIQNLGGPSLRWVAPAALVAAMSLHGTILLLPAARPAAPLPPPSPPPEFPRVWRLTAPALPSPVPLAVDPPPAVRQAQRPAPELPIPAHERRPMRTEPIPEPPPEIALTTIPADIEAIIPNPSPPSPSAETGPPSSVPSGTPPNAEPALIEQVPPLYPAAARSFRAEGRVTLKLSVLPDGSVGGATVLESSRPGLGFEAAALEAVKRWRYEPAPLEAGARKVVVRVHFRQGGERP